MTPPATNNPQARDTRDIGIKPNILLIMSDEHGPMFSSTYGHPIVRTPGMDALAARGAVFESAYCNSPLCVPSRMSFLAGKHVHRVAAYDNHAPLAPDVPTWAHLLRAAGYQVVLDGKMHFVGPDQRHGFEAQLSPRYAAITPAVAGAEWRDEHPMGGPGARQRILEAGPGRGPHLDRDDEVEAVALDWLRQPARNDAPWCLTASFITPHFPLIVPEPYFSRYYPHNVDAPVLSPGFPEGLHPAHERVRRTFNLYDYTEEQIRVARAAYYGLVTFMDEKLGHLVDALRETGQLENTVVIYTADHGELAGDHGLWWKNSFYEQSARVPLIVSWPGQIDGGLRLGGATSLVDVARTLLDIAGAPDPGDWDGDSLLPRLRAARAGTAGDVLSATAAAAETGWKDEAICEYYAHATNRPHRMLRSGRWKYNYYHGEAPELYDLHADPQEHHNLAGQPHTAATESALHRRLLAGWDPTVVERQVRRSQRDRNLIALGDGGRTRRGRPPH